ncbi:hypothetical protein C8R45DRAFT_1102787 [Mycena sanguinolenta]|nr:hypothetical protein C8R45DRAFT_1102787 [Mycena sanguinolenta]
MPSKHDPEAQKLIDSVSMGVITAFRSSVRLLIPTSSPFDASNTSKIYTLDFIKNNPELWVDTDWINVVQLRKFLGNAAGVSSGGSAPSECTPTRVKLESDASNASLVGSLPVPDIKVRTWKEGEKDFIEILSDSEDVTPGMSPSRNPDYLSPTKSSYTRSSSSPLPPSDDSSAWDTATDSPSSPFDISPHALGSAAPTDRDGSFSRLSDLPKSDTLKVTTEVTVDRVEYLTDLPSLYPIAETPTAFVVDLQDPKSHITKKGALCSADALIKNKDNDSWEGGTGSRDSYVWVTFEPGADPIQCCRSRLNCKGAFACERVDPRLLKVVRRDLDPVSCDAVFAAQRQTRRDEGTPRERRVTEFLQLVRSQTKCPARTDGVECQGVPILRNKNQMSRPHKFWIGCSGYDARSIGKHNSSPIPVDVDESMFDTKLCSAIVHPTTGLKQHHCPHNHIIDGSAVTSSIIHHECPARRTTYVPLVATVRTALIIHPHNTAHNHPMPSLKKLSLQVKESYRNCVRAAGCVAATVKKVDNGTQIPPSTRFLLGMKPGEFAPALQSNKAKQKLVREVKMEKYPDGVGVPGAFKLFFEDMQKGVDERYIQRLAIMPDGGIMILTRVEGEINKWEVVLFLKALERAVTIARAYVNQASTEFYERLFDEFQAVKLDDRKTRPF